MGLEVQVDLPVTADGEFDAVAGWFTLHLGNGLACKKCSLASFIGLFSVICTVYTV